MGATEAEIEAVEFQRFLTARADSGTFGSNVPFAFIEFILIPQEDLDDDL